MLDSLLHTVQLPQVWVPRYLDVFFFGVGPGKGVGLQGQGVGSGMSGVRLVGALGRDQTYVSAGNPTHRRANGRRGNGRKGPVPGAGVGNGGNKVRFQEVPEDIAAGKVGVEVSGAAPKGQSKTQRDLILEAVEALKALLGQGVGTQVVDLIQEHIHFPRSPSELERAQHLATLLGDKARLDESIQEEEEKVSKARLAVAEAEDDLSILQQEVKGLVNQIDAHHREDDARRERSQGGNDGQGVFVEEADSGEEVGVQADCGERRKVGKGRFGGGLSSARELSPAQLLELLHGMSEARPPSGVTWGRTEVTTCPLLRVTILLVFVLKTRLKRRVFNLVKPGEKCLRSAVFVGSGTRKDQTFLKKKNRFFWIPFFLRAFFLRCWEAISQVPQGCLSLGRGSSAGCEDDFESDEYVASAGTGFSGWGEDNFDCPVHDFENSLVDGFAGNVLGDADIVVAAARRGENASGSH